MSSQQRINRRLPLLLAGPTAVGKSEVALLLAEQLGGEIISVDSMQVYRGLDIGTDKPSSADRERVPHHLIDAVKLTESFDAAQFVRLAQEAVADIQSRERVPILCGGTGLYFKAFLHGLGEAPPASPAIRTDLENTPLPQLLAELAGKDPVTYARIDRQNPRRVIRALEVIRITGRPYSEQRAVWENAAARNPGKFLDGQEACPMVGLARSIEDLRRRIDTRVGEMFRRGLVAETRRLLEQGVERNKTAMQALGYRQVVEHLRGERSLEETVELVRTRTRQFAKRQMTWFRRQLPVSWIQVEPGSDVPQTAARVLAEYRKRQAGRM